MKHITSPDNPFYKELLKLSGSARQRGKSGQTLLDGTHLLDALITSGKTPLHLLITEASHQDPEIKSLQQKIPNVPLTILDEALFAGLSELKSVSGIIAQISVAEADWHTQDCQFCLLLENIQDPGNLGSMLRSAAAAGCDAVYMSKGCADAWSPKVLRAAMGGHFVMNLYENIDLLNIINILDINVFAAVLSDNASLYDSQLTGKIAFAIGNEGAGLTHPLLAKSKPVSIPMPGKVESLNAAAAAAICLFEAVRQRSNL